MRRDNDIRRIALQVSIALSAGVFSIMPSASAAPELDHVVSGGAVVDQTASPQVTDVTSTTRNNVIDWKDFSVAQGETVRFDKGEKINNYLNVVSGVNTSQIDGAIKGGDNVYIVNPNGVVFGNSASVDVGSLYVSSRPLEDVNYTKVDVNGDMQPLADTASMNGGDIVNLGTVQANSVFVEGGNIFLGDVDRIKTADGKDVNNNVTIQTEGDITLGRSVSAMAAEEKANQLKGSMLKGTSATTNNTSSLGSKYKLTANNNLKSTGGISKESDFDYVREHLGDSYYMSDDVTITATEWTPIGTDATNAFTGTFDGRYHTVAGINVSSGTYGGLFGYTKNATIENVGVSNVGYTGKGITSAYAGGIVGFAENTSLTNVFNEGVAVTKSGTKVDNYAISAGGIVGYALVSSNPDDNITSINTAYNTGLVSGGGVNVAGIVGTTQGAVAINNVYNSNSNITYGLAGYSTDTQVSSIDNAYTTSTNAYSAGFKGKKTHIVTAAAGKKSIDDYGDLDKIKNVGTNDSVETTVWRIYEGQTTPLLRAFLLKGGSAVTVNYNYTHGSQTGSNGGADLTADSTTSNGTLTYNGSYMIVDESEQPVTYSGVDDVDTNKIFYGSDEDTNGVKNAKTKALFYSNQQGYEIIGGNVTMGKRRITVKDSDIDLSKVYDSKTDATAAFQKAFSEGAGSGTAGGVLAVDKGVVSIDYTGVTAAFSDKNVGEDKVVTLTGTINLVKTGTTAAAQEVYDSYYIDDDDKSLTGSTVKGTITPRTLFLTINPTSGIDKIYDGSAEVAAKYAAANVIKLDTDTTVDPDDAQNSTSGLITGDSVALKGNTAKAYYVDADETHNSNAGAHKVLYTGVALDTASTDAQNYVLKYQTGTGTDTQEVAVTGGKVLLDGTINRRLILSNDFKVKVGGVVQEDATKPYNGDDSYTLPKGAELVAPTGSSGDTGVIKDDEDYVHFALKSSGSYFTDDEGVRTANAYDNTIATNKSSKVAYAIDVTADEVTRDGKKVNLLANYQIGTTEEYEAGTAKNLDTATDLTVGGTGKITRLAVNITAANVTGIEKEYDGDNNLKATDDNYVEYTTMGNKVQYAANSPTLVGNDQFIISVEYDDENVRRNAAGEVLYNEKDVYFKTYIDGDAAGNYTLNGTNAETYNSTSKLTLTGAKGTITPKIITPVFNTISKTYDGSEAINTGDANTSTYDWESQPVDGDTVNLIYSTAKDKAYFTEADGTTKAQDVSKAAKVRYTDLALDNGNYELSAQELTSAGAITRRLILSNSFTVNGQEASKVYDGTPTYTLQAGATLTSQAGASGNTGVVAADVPYLHFSLNPNGQTYFTEDDGTTAAQDVVKAKKVAYAIDATTDTGYEHLLGNYKLGTTTSADNLDANATNLHVSGDGHIDRRALTITAAGVTGINKTYDTTDVVEDENGSDYFTMGKAVKYATNSPELVSDDGTSWNIEATYNGADVYRDPTTKEVVADGKDVTFKVNIAGDADIVANYTLNDEDAETYSTSPLELTGAKGTINPATITPVFNTITKTYTGTTLITDGGANSSQVTLQGNLDGNAVTLNYATDKDHAYFANANAGDYTGTVTYKGFSLEGAKSGNYQLLSDTATGDGKINKATIGMSDLKFTVTSVSREYNAGEAVGDNAVVEGMDAYIDFGDGKNDVKFTYTAIDSAVYSSNGTGNSVAGAGTGKEVTYTISGITVPEEVLANFDWKTGDGYQNTKTYKIADVGTITPKKVYATVIGPVEKTYDATTAVKNGDTVLTGESLVHIEGLLNDGSENETEAVYIDSSVGAADAADHGTQNKSVKYTVKLDANSAANYVIYDDKYYTTKASESDKFTTHNNTINQRDLTLTFNPVTKVYDGYTDYGNSTVKDGGAVYTFNGKQGSDAITIADGYTANASYNSANVKEANTVTYDKLIINGNEKGNYRLLDKDGNVMTADANDQYTTIGAGTISKYQLNSAPTITFNHVNKEYDGTNKVVYSRNASENDPRKFINAKVNNESLGFDLVSAVYTGGSSVNSDDGQTIRTGGAQNSAQFTIKFSSDNYEFSNISDTNFYQLTDGSYQYSATYNNATITPRTITVTLGDALSNDITHYVTKTYNGDADVQQSITRELFNFGDSDVLSKADGSKDKVYLAYNNTAGDAVQAAYDNKNAGDNKDVTYTLALAGDDANNYKLNTTTLTGEGDIQKAELVIDENTFAAVEKTYDGNNNVTTLTTDKIYLQGVQKADGTYETINLDNAIWDGTGSSTNKIIGKYDSANVQWKPGTDEEDFQGVTYSNLQNALESMTDGDGEKISTNYTVADTKYFAAAKEKGKIKAISITQEATKNWTTVTKEYDASDKVDGVVYAYDPLTGNKGNTLLNSDDILKLTVKDKDNNDITIDYEATANFDEKDVSDNRTLNYTITKVDKKVKDQDGNSNYKLQDNVYNNLQGQTLTSEANNKISKRQINAMVKQDTDVTKVYDGTKNASADNFVLDEADRKVLEADGYTVSDVIQKTATYSDENATISPGEANTNTLTIAYTLSTTADAQNYEVSTPDATAHGDITRRTVSIVTTPVTVNAGEAMPTFTGTVTGFVKDEQDNYSDFINGIRYKAADGVTTNTPGSYGVYGWYMDDKSGLLGNNYIYNQASSNATALTVNYVNNNTGNPDTKITPNNNIYNQISKDVNSGFGDNGAAAIEYKDKSGKVLGTENIDSGEINSKGLMIGGGTDMSKQADSNANIGIAGGDIVNMEGANAAGAVNVETTGDGTVVNLEVFSIGGDKQSGDNNSAAEITNTADKTYSLDLDNSTEGEIAIKNTNDTTGTLSSIAITDGKQNILGEEAEDKKDEQEKEGTIAIKSSNGEDDDEIELTVEKDGVNVA